MNLKFFIQLPGSVALLVTGIILLPSFTGKKVNIPLPKRQDIINESRGYIPVTPALIYIWI